VGSKPASSSRPRCGTQQAEVLNSGRSRVAGHRGGTPATRRTTSSICSTPWDPDSNGVDDNDAGVRTPDALSDQPPRTRTSSIPHRATVLLGQTWAPRVFPSGFGPRTRSARCASGSMAALLVSCGEGAPLHAGGLGRPRSGTCSGPGRTDSIQNIGAFRAQDITSLAGKILRIHPTDGKWLPEQSVSSMAIPARCARGCGGVWACANPFRFCVRPGDAAADSSLGRPGRDLRSAMWAGTRGRGERPPRRAAPISAGPTTKGTRACSRIRSSIRSITDSPPSAPSANPSAARARPTMTWSHSDSTLSRPTGIRGNLRGGRGVVVPGAARIRRPTAIGTSSRDFGPQLDQDRDPRRLESGSNRFTELRDRRARPGRLRGRSSERRYPLPLHLHRGTLYRIRYTGSASRQTSPPAASRHRAGDIGLRPALGRLLERRVRGSGFGPRLDLVEFRETAWARWSAKPAAHLHRARPPTRRSSPSPMARGGLTRDTVIVTARARGCCRSP